MAVILLAGDSITYGFWDSEGGWAGRLRTFLDSRVLSASDPATLNSTRYIAVYNLGIPGDTSRGLKARFEQETAPRLNDEQETISIIAIGTNDSALLNNTQSHQIPLEETKANLTFLIQSAKKLGKVAVLGLPLVDEKRTDPIYWKEDYSYKNEYLKIYNDAIKEVAGVENTEFLDIFEMMKDMETPHLLEDGIHPNSQGHQWMFETIKAFLTANKFI
jgi:lysophospholipase L1-like esterase